LQDDLAKAVEAEEFELAAKLRDEIRQAEAGTAP
jgi:protein-arginine kinase activator protein McsA